MNGTDYDSLEITATEMAGVLGTEPTPTPELVPAAKPADEKPAPEPTPETQAEPVVVKIKVKDSEYTEDEIAAALDDSKNKAAWNKTNTEEAMRLADVRKKVEPVVKFLEKLKADGEFGDELRDSMVERFGDEFADTIDAVLKFDEKEVPNPFADDLKTEREKREAAEHQLFVIKEKREFAKSEKVSEKKADEVWEFAEKTFMETGEVISLSNAFKLMQHDELKRKAAAPPPPKAPNVPDSSPGAKEIKAQPAKSYEDISIEGFKLFE